MTTTDQDAVLQAVEDARRILREYIMPGPRDATQTVHRLIEMSLSTLSIELKSAGPFALWNRSRVVVHS